MSNLKKIKNKERTREKALEKLALFCLKWKSSYKGLSKQFLKEYNKF
ncbi:hypothetical protein BMWSH_4841 [Priestia megaterium WSH-002]|uniref:Uncharacterized protein n=1 Tax=Priestia megaterium (strain WSH-002) TaxID=1006007 RepID=A0A8D4DZC5_PRIMW|nr:hypothetical protein BMWSH_4841 [Priestia megaterium WSH-002]